MDASPFHSSPETGVRSVPRVVTVLEEDVLSGVLGAGVVALFFLLLDALSGRLLYTPTLLGSVLFLGASVDDVTSVDATLVFAYTGLHVLLFIGAGAALAWMVCEFERNPQLGMVLLLIFLLFQSVVFGLEVTLVPSLVGALSAWTVAVANIVAAAAMLGYLLRRHPGAWARLAEGGSE